MYLTSGRSKSEIYPNLWNIGFDGLIGGNGMYIEHNNQIIQDKVMSISQVKKAVDWLQKNKLGFYLESKNGLFANEYLLERGSYIFGENTEENRNKLLSAMPCLIFGENLYRDDVAKISFALNPNKLDEAKEKFSKTFDISAWTATGKRKEFGEFALIGADKVNAIKTLLNYLNITNDNTFSFGDAYNDHLMIEYCNIGVAMGNSQDGLKDVADYITDHVDNNGLYNAFKNLNLI